MQECFAQRAQWVNSTGLSIFVNFKIRIESCSLHVLRNRIVCRSVSDVFELAATVGLYSTDGTFALLNQKACLLNRTTIEGDERERDKRIENSVLCSKFPMTFLVILYFYLSLKQRLFDCIQYVYCLVSVTYTWLHYGVLNITELTEQSVLLER